MDDLPEKKDPLREQYRSSANLDARIRLHSQYSTNSYGWYRWMMDHLLVMPRNASILELGCGPASAWSSQLSRVPQGWKVVLSDFSTGMLEKAVEVVGEHAGFRLARIDAQALPFAPDTFDGVIANHMLYHVPNREKALAEIRRVLKPGGIFFAATNGLGHMRELDELIWKALPDWDTAAAKNSTQNIITAFSLENGGAQINPYFDRVELALYPDGLEVDQAGPLVDYILSMVFLFAQDQRDCLQEKTANIEQVIVNELRAHGSIHITKNAGVFIAR